MQEAAGELTPKQRSRTNQKRRGSVRPPRAVGPEILDGRAVNRQLIKAERGDIEDVIQVAGVAHAEEDKQVVDQHHQQHAVDDAQHIDARRLLFQVGVRRPEGQRRLNRALTFQAQINTLPLPRWQPQFKHVVVLLDLAAGERQGIAGVLAQLIASLRIGQVQLHMIKWRIGQLQQPGLVTIRLLRAVFQVQAQPEHRTRIASIQYALVMLTEAGLQGWRGDVLDAGIAAYILEYRHGRAERQAAGVFVKNQCPGQPWHQHE